MYIVNIIGSLIKVEYCSFSAGDEPLKKWDKLPLPKTPEYSVLLGKPHLYFDSTGLGVNFTHKEGVTNWKKFDEQLFQHSTSLDLEEQPEHSHHHHLQVALNTQDGGKVVALPSQITPGLTYQDVRDGKTRITGKLQSILGESPSISQTTSDNYNKIINNEENDLKKAKALLRDYVDKGTGLGSIFCYFHWNRHHTDAIQAMLVDQKNQSIATIRSALAGIASSPNFNPEGSLARRIAFMEENLSDFTKSPHTAPKKEPEERRDIGAATAVACM